MSAGENEIASRYRELCLDWARLRLDPEKANRAFKKHHAYYKSIRNLPHGQQAIRALLTDPDASVRLLAATHSLAFSPDPAELVLTELSLGGDMYALDAKYTLMSFRTGGLDLDW